MLLCFSYAFPMISFIVLRLFLDFPNKKYENPDLGQILGVSYSKIRVYLQKTEKNEYRPACSENMAENRLKAFSKGLQPVLTLFKGPNKPPNVGGVWAVFV